MNILIHHDERLYSEALACMLMRRGHDVSACTSTVEELFQAAAHSRAQICLIELKPYVLMSTLQELRRIVPALPIVVLSTDLRPSTLSTAIAAGADGVCLKIDSIGEVERVMNEACARRRAPDRGAPIWSHTAVSLAKRKLSTRTSSMTPKAIELTLKERAVLELLVQGATTAKVASTLEIGEATVRTHLQHLFNKFGVHSRLALVASALRRQVLQLDELGRVAAPHDTAKSG